MPSDGSAVPIDRAEVRRVAALARLELGEAEAERLAAELRSILDYVAQIAELDLEAEKDRDEPAPARLRDDVALPCLDSAEATRGAPQADAALFRVPHVLAADDGDG